MAEQLISLYREENLHAPIAEAYMYAALQNSANGQQFMAVKYASLAVEKGMLYAGPDYKDVVEMRSLMDDPGKHWSWKLRERLREMMP
jgi:hypothetical protein